MNAKEFVSNWVVLKEELVGQFMDEQGQSEVASQIRAMRLSAEQSVQMRAVLDGALRDTMYTLLVGLDGEASIGNSQQQYAVLDENGNRICGPGDLEVEAYEQFQGTD